ncbi:TIGR00341 family protein [Algoriphagus sp. PAP.12]|uniref:TIGR00341 family protein n=1 Tax=Algoriphagus sp. PAP.12 TaxID=2996678 RepID=UPI00227B36BE|nr:TIGR00341 family protein [Algoriphagus sp. PAP.12]
MDSYTLIFDPNLEKEDKDAFFEKLDPAPNQKIPFNDLSLSDYSSEDDLLLWINDQQGQELIQKLDENSPAIHFLPHPELTLLARSFGVPNSKEAAFIAFKEQEKTPPYDLLSINDQLCLNSLVIGESLSVLYDSIQKGFFKNIADRFSRFKKLFQKVKLRKYKITYGDDESAKTLEIAAMGILAVSHCESNLIFKRVIKDSGLNEGLLHVIILAPKSLFSIIQFGMQNLFFPVKGSAIPDFLSYISTKKLTIESEEEFGYALDGKEEKSNQLELEIRSEKVKIQTYFESTKENESQKKELNLKALPTGKLREELTRGYLPWVRHATYDEFKELFTLLRQNSQTTSNYLVLMALSTLIATFGLFANSTPVVIGAMILAPLMAPIISLAMGALRQDGLLVKNSLITIFWGVLIGLIFAMLITLITPLHSMNSEIQSRIRPNLLDLGIAIVSGVAGAFAYSKEEIAKTLAGVAISVALVPPLAVAGIGLGWGDWNVFWGAFLLLGTNLAGIVMAASLTFLLLGFSPFQLAKKGLLISVGILVLVTAPLIFSFRNMVLENRLIQELGGKEIPHGLMRDVKVIGLNPVRLSVTILSKKPLDENDFREIKKEIEDVIQQPTELELTLGVEVFD